MSKKKNNEVPKITFLPGSLDNFDGTPEELAQMLAEVMRLAISGELVANSKPASFDDLSAEEIEAVAKFFDADKTFRNL